MTAKPTWAPPSTLPPLYAGWMDDLLGGPVPHETVATCEDCAMCARGGEPPGDDAVFFAPDIKCCTYVPILPNFLVGRILDDPDPALAAGRATVEARIAGRVGVTPLGLARPPVQHLLYQHGAPLAFGRSRTLRCPHYLDEGGGRCGIWRHRNGVCATWFCKYARAAPGQRFWRALLQLLTAVEHNLAPWCLLRLDVSPEALERLFPHKPQPLTVEPLDAAQIDGTVDEAVYRALWGNWQGRERELFRASAHLIDRLAWEEVAAIGGSAVAVFARLAVEAYRCLCSDRVPLRLRLAPYQVVDAGPDHMRVVSYSALDPLDVPRRLLEVLPSFDGRPTGETLRRIQKEKGIRVEAALVRRLVDFGILAPPTERGERTMPSSVNEP